MERDDEMPAGWDSMRGQGAPVPWYRAPTETTPFNAPPAGPSKMDMIAQFLKKLVGSQGAAAQPPRTWDPAQMGTTPRPGMPPLAPNSPILRPPLGRIPE